MSASLALPPHHSVVGPLTSEVEARVGDLADGGGGVAGLVDVAVEDAEDGGGGDDGGEDEAGLEEEEPLLG